MLFESSLSLGSSTKTIRILPVFLTISFLPVRRQKRRLSFLNRSKEGRVLLAVEGRIVEEEVLFKINSRGLMGYPFKGVLSEAIQCRDVINGVPT